MALLLALATLKSPFFGRFIMTTIVLFGQE